MKNLFEHISTNWIRYSKYELLEDRYKLQYVVPAKDAQPEFYNPLDEAEDMVVHALNIGMMCLSEKPENDIQDTIMDFISHYGLLGFMTALCTTTSFINQDAVYLIPNRHIKKKQMKVKDYLDLFFPFEKPDFIRRGRESMWSVELNKTAMSLMMTMGEQPTALNMEFQPYYGERYIWLKRQFKDWAFIFYTSILYYDGKAIDSEDGKKLLRQGMAAFDGMMPKYHIGLFDKPEIVWDFHSLLLAIQIMFSFMLVNEKNPMRICEHCSKVFVAKRPNTHFCSHQCKNRHYKYKNKD